MSHMFSTIIQLCIGFVDILCLGYGIVISAIIVSIVYVDHNILVTNIFMSNDGKENDNSGHSFVAVLLLLQY